MKATIYFLRDRFNKFNNTIFKNPLPMPDMQISSAKSYVGRFKTERNRLTREKKYILSLSNRYDLPEQVLEDVVIHEMIHYMISHQGIKDTSPHGQVFKKAMNEINRRFGRHITVSHRFTAEQLESDQQRVHNIMCICKMTDGRELICKVSQSRIFEIYRAFEDWELVEEQEWYWVYGSHFNHYRKVLTPKLYKADEESIEKIKKGTRLEFTKHTGGGMEVRPATK